MNLVETVNLVTFTEEVLNGNLYLLCSDKYASDANKGLGIIYSRQNFPKN